MSGQKFLTLPNSLGIILIILGILAAVAPHTFLPVCQYMGMLVKTAAGTQIPMKCFWTANAEVALGVMVVVVAGVLIASTQRETKRALGIVGAILGILIILMPTALIGTCMDPKHPCNVYTLPGELIFGALILILSIVITVMPGRPLEVKKT
mgnify:CR=1 FL=1